MISHWDMGLTDESRLADPGDLEVALPLFPQSWDYRYILSRPISPFFFFYVGAGEIKLRLRLCGKHATV